MARKKSTPVSQSGEAAPNIVIITGLSGSGMSAATNAFEDLGIFLRRQSSDHDVANVCPSGNGEPRWKGH